MKSCFLSRIMLGSALLIIALAANAQTARPAAGANFRGFNAYESFRGTADSAGAVLKLDSSVGYDFNRNVGIFFGLPLYFTHDSASAAGPSRQRNGIGDVYFGGELYLPNRVADYSSTVTIGAPSGSVSDGFGTGHVTFDWSHRLRKKMGRLAPFAVAGVSNSVPDTETLTRTFTSLGNLLHFEEGAEFDLARRVYVGASSYQIVPFGNQQVFARTGDGLQPQGVQTQTVQAQPRDQGSGKTGGNTGAGAGSPGATGNNNDQPSATGNDITRENGFDAWIGFEPTRTVRMELGYSRSVTFAVNRVSFNLSLNVGRLLRLRRTQ
jgi:hypothetical protein